MHAIAQQQCYSALAAAAPPRICAFFAFFRPQRSQLLSSGVMHGSHRFAVGAAAAGA